MADYELLRISNEIVIILTTTAIISGRFLLTFSLEVMFKVVVVRYLTLCETVLYTENNYNKIVKYYNFHAEPFVSLSNSLMNNDFTEYC